MDAPSKRLKIEDQPLSPDLLHSSTSSFTRRDTERLNISFEGHDGWLDDTAEYDIAPFFRLRDEKVPLDPQDLVGYTKQELSLINYLLETRRNEDVKLGTQESNTDSFVNYVLGKLELNEHPCSLRLMQQYKFDFSGQSISSTPEFTVEFHGRVVLVDEDKHFNNAKPSLQWGEYQIAGEMVAVASSNRHKQLMDRTWVDGPVGTIYTVRVIGSRFTFYKCDFSKEYLDMLGEDEPLEERAVIWRCPNNNTDNAAYSYWDYFIPDDRKKIIKALYQIKTYVSSLTPPPNAPLF
jgi:hypothetical protein